SVPKAPGGERAVQVRRLVHHGAPLVQRACFLDGRGLDEAVFRRQRLPLEREQTMTLEVAEGAVVCKHVESVVRAFERPPRLVATIGTVADIATKDRDTFRGRHLTGDRQQLIVWQ